MSEEPPVSETAETMTPFREVELHNQTVQLTPGQVLGDLETTRARGFNGTMLAEIVLPTPIEPGRGEDKKLALIDFGDVSPEGKAILFLPDTGTEVRAAGITRSRYGLMSLNYTPPDALAGFMLLPVGSAKMIGKSKSIENARLGLSETDEYLAGSHATITVEDTGGITIEDHSLNGTKVILPA